MARKTIRIAMSINNPDDFSKLLNTCRAQHQKMGDESPLAGNKFTDMDNFSVKLDAADKLRKQSEAKRAESETDMQQAKLLYGTGEGQNITTKDTLYYDLDTIKRTLLNANKGNETALGNFGFGVTIGQAKSPKPRVSKISKENKD